MVVVVEKGEDDDEEEEERGGTEVEGRVMDVQPPMCKPGKVKGLVVGSVCDCCCSS